MQTAHPAAAVVLAQMPPPTTKSQFQFMRQGSRSLDHVDEVVTRRISELADNWAPSSPTTTTTTVRPTTATTATTTTTVANGVAPPSGGNSGNGGHSGNGGNSGGSGSGSGSSGAPPGAQVDPVPTGTGDGQSTTGQTDSNDLMVMAQTPAQAEFLDTTSTQAQDEAGVTSQVSGMLQMVLLPAIVDLVLSPLLILEILLRTSLAGQKVLIPILLLVACAVLMSVTDRRSRKTSLVMAPLNRPRDSLIGRKPSIRASEKG